MITDIFLWKFGNDIIEEPCSTFFISLSSLAIGFDFFLVIAQSQLNKSFFNKAFYLDY